MQNMNFMNGQWHILSSNIIGLVLIGNQGSFMLVFDRLGWICCKNLATLLPSLIAAQSFRESDSLNMKTVE